MDGLQSRVVSAEPDFVEILALFYRKKSFLALVTVICLALSLGAFHLSRKSYKTSLTVKVGRFAYYNIPIETNRTLMIAFSQENVLNEIAKRSGLTGASTTEIESRFKIKDLGEFLSIISYGNTPKEAVHLAKAVASVLIERHELILRQKSGEKEAVFRGWIETLEKEIEQIKNRIKSSHSDFSNPALAQILEMKEARKVKYEIDVLELRQQNKLSQAEIITSPPLPTVPIHPNLAVYLSVSALLGLFLASWWIIGFEYWLRNKNKIMRAT